MLARKILEITLPTIGHFYNSDKCYRPIFPPPPGTKWVFSKFLHFTKFLFFHSKHNPQFFRIQPILRSCWMRLCAIISNFNWIIRGELELPFSKSSQRSRLSATFRRLPGVIVRAFRNQSMQRDWFSSGYHFNDTVLFLVSRTFLARFFCAPAGHRDVTLNFVHVCSLSSRLAEAREKGTATKGEFTTRLDSTIF